MLEIQTTQGVLLTSGVPTDLAALDGAAEVAFELNDHLRRYHLVDSTVVYGSSFNSTFDFLDCSVVVENYIQTSLQLQGSGTFDCFLIAIFQTIRVGNALISKLVVAERCILSPPSG